MALEDIPDVGENFLTQGFGSKSYANRVIDRSNLWAHMFVNTGGSARGTGKFVVSEERVVLDLSKLKIAVETTHRLQLIAANTATVPKIRVRLGYVAGAEADPAMTDPGDDPVFLLTLPNTAGTYYIYCDVTVAYDVDSGIWSRNGANAINYNSNAPAGHPNTATKIYVYLGTVSVAANTAPATGFAASVVNQVVSGDQGVARHGNSGTYSDYNWLI